MLISVNVSKKVVLDIIHQMTADKLMEKYQTEHTKNDASYKLLIGLLQ